ncbi:hypothetical protein ABTO19_19090, partial [Acinetobacter baumannii]
LLVHYLRQGCCARWLAAKRIRHQLCHLFVTKWAKADLFNKTSGTAYCPNLARKRMFGINLVISIRADQHQASQVGLNKQIFN